MGRLLSTTELAAQLNLHAETIRRLARERRIPSVRICRVLRFDPDAVEQALLKSQGPSAAALQPA
jgi:excisionase family DNA binding protein